MKPKELPSFSLEQGTTQTDLKSPMLLLLSKGMLEQSLQFANLSCDPLNIYAHVYFVEREGRNPIYLRGSEVNVSTQDKA